MIAEDYKDSKNYLMKTSSDTGRNVYDQLSELIHRLLTQRPANAADLISDVIKSMQRQEFKNTDEIMLNKEGGAEKIAESARRLRKLFEKDEDVEALEASNLGDADLESPTPNLQELLGQMQQADLGLGARELTLLSLSLKRLVDQRPSIETVRFWGKVFGLEKDYLVAEVDFRDGEEEEDDDDIGNRDSAAAATEAESQQAENTEEVDDSDDDGAKGKVAELPKPNYKPPPTPPTEPQKTGANLKTYFVCNDPGQEWTKLPPVTPNQIVAARLIRKFFTGRLDAEVASYPLYPGTEKNYLRAQLARISAACHISPVGFFQFDEDEDEEDGAAHRSFLPNLEFEGLHVKELIDASMVNWAHHVLYILPQGRTAWWNPVSKGEGDVDEGEEEDEDKEASEGMPPEVGPPLLTPLSEDAELGGVRPWSARVSTRLLPKQAIARVSSNLWPGAHAFANNKMHENIYIGWGLKSSAYYYNPPLPSHFFTEYPPVPEIEETEDPTPAQEKVTNPSGEGEVEQIREGEGQDDDANDDEDEDED